MNDRKSFYDIASFYNQKAVLAASYQGMRYQLKKSENPEKDGEVYLSAVIWPEPFSFEKTPEERKEYRSFPYTEEGLDEAYEWICNQYDEKREMWEHVRDHPMEVILQKKDV